MMDGNKEQDIAQEYKGFVKLANELTEQDVKNFPPTKKEKPEWRKRDIYSEHILDMIEMFQAKYGTPRMSKYETAWKLLKAYYSGANEPAVLQQMERIEETEIADKAGRRGVAVSPEESLGAIKNSRTENK